jgi:predicted kinase
MEAIIFVGVQGSGKTSFYRQRFLTTHVHISLDETRTRQREQALLTECLYAKRQFVIDNTNPLTTDRKRYIVPARTIGFRVVCYFFQTSLRDAIYRNNQRTAKKRIPVPAVVATFRKLQPPTLAEDFDAVYTVTISPGETFVVTAERITNTDAHSKGGNVRS